MNTFFTADPHFYHDAIIESCKRPYKNSHQMNKDLFRRFNERVTNLDTVYILGDLTMLKDREPIKRIIEKLNGRKHLILGNHDYLRPFDYVELGFISVHTSLEIFTPYGNFVLAHDPAISQVDRSKIFLCGHIHDLFIKQKNCINVGVDINNFYPFSIQEVSTLALVSNPPI